MIRWMRTAQIAAGKNKPAITWAKEITEFSKKYEGISSINVFMDSFGQAGTIRWIVDYKNFASFEKVQKQIADDQEYWQMVEKVPELFIIDKIHDTLMTSI